MLDAGRIVRFAAIGWLLFEFVPGHPPEGATGRTATLSGRVVDHRGQPLPGARVILAGDGVGRISVTSGAHGEYRFPALRPFHLYNMTAELSGYRTVTYDGMRLEAGRTRTMEFRLKRPADRDIVALVGRDPFPYEGLVGGFTRRIGVPVRVIDLDEESDPAEAVRRVRAERPNLILGAGLRAARLIRREIPDIPSILTLVTDPRRYDLETATLCFLGSNPSAPDLVQRLASLMPGARRFGLAYSADTSSLLARDVRAMAESREIQIVLRPARRARDLKEGLDTLLGRIDALVVLYDELTATPEALDHLAGWSLRHRVPLVAPGPEWVRRGALFSHGAPLDRIGEEAAGLAAQILFQGRQPADFKIRAPRDHFLAVNRETAAMMNVDIPPDLQIHEVF